MAPNTCLILFDRAFFPVGSSVLHLPHIFASLATSFPQTTQFTSVAGIETSPPSLGLNKPTVVAEATNLIGVKGSCSVRRGRIPEQPLMATFDRPKKATPSAGTEGEGSDDVS